MSTNNTEQADIIAAAGDAMKIMEDSLAAAKAACEERDRALDKIKEAEERIVELEKVAMDMGHSFRGIADIFVDAGLWDEIDLQEKMASLIDDPGEAPRLVRGLLQFSAGSSKGSGLPKAASYADQLDEEEREEREAWLKVASDGAAG